MPLFISRRRLSSSFPWRWRCSIVFLLKGRSLFSFASNYKFSLLSWSFHWILFSSLRKVWESSPQSWWSIFDSLVLGNHLLGFKGHTKEQQNWRLKLKKPVDEIEKMIRSSPWHHVKLLAMHTFRASRLSYICLWTAMMTMSQEYSGVFFSRLN